MTTLTKKQVLTLIKSRSSKGFLERTPSEIEKNVREIINFLIPQGIQEVKGLAKYLKGKTDTETAFNIHAFCRKFVKPTADPIGKELISYPYQTLKRGKGDCEDCSGLIGSLLSVCNIDSVLRVADCEDGYSHIYNVVPTLNLVVDGTLKVCGAEIKRTKYKDYSVNKGLGKLPVEYWSERERFVVNLWEEINKLDKVKVFTKTVHGKYGKVQVRTNSLPLSLNRDQLSKFITDKFPNTKVINPNGSFEIEVILNNGQIFKVSYEGLADLIYKIQGSEGLKVKPKVDEIISKTALSPFNAELMKFMTPFISSDPLRPAFNGVHFQPNSVAATNGHILMVIYGEKNSVEQTGIFEPDTLEKIEENFLPFESAFNENSPYYFEANTDEMIKAVKQSAKFTNKSTYKIVFSITSEIIKITAEDLDYSNEAFQIVKCNSNATKRYLSLNAKFFLICLNTLNKSGIKTFRLQFSEQNKSAFMNFNSKHGFTRVLIMPVMLNDYNKEIAEKYLDQVDDFGYDYEVMKNSLLKLKL